MTASAAASIVQKVDFIVWLENTPGSVALRESLYAYSLIESAHVLAITLFVGTIAMVDLRLLGFAFRPVPISQMTARILPWTIAGFLIVISTGVLLFYGAPIRTFHSLWFRVKVLLILAAAINIVNFHFRVERDRERWDRDELPPRNVRWAGAISLLMWMSVIVMGRMIAYGWFDCDRVQSVWTLWFTGCSAVGP